MRFIIGLVVVFTLSVLSACDRDADRRGGSGAGSDRVILGDHQHAKDFGAHTIHVNAFTTDQLSPDIARVNQITRSKNKAMLNLFIEKSNRDNSTIQSAEARVKVAARNLSNQLKIMEMRQVVDKSSTYYIGEVSVGNGETLIFDIDIVPEGRERPYLLSYRQQFFTE